MSDTDLSASGERVLATLGRLTRGALHEISNPLLGLMGSAEFALREAPPGTKLQGRLELVHSTGLEIAEIVRALQAFVREQHTPPTRFALGDAADAAVALMRRVSPLGDVELAVRREAEPDVVAAPGRVAAALVELLLDGIADAARGDTLELVVSREGADAVAALAGAGELRLPAEERS